MNVQGGSSISNTQLQQVAWLNNGDLPPLVAGVLATQAGVSQNDVDNRLGFSKIFFNVKLRNIFYRFFFGLNEPNIAHDACTTRPGGQSGNCRHLHHCVEQVVNFFSFLQNMCLIQVLPSANSEL